MVLRQRCVHRGCVHRELGDDVVGLCDGDGRWVGNGGNLCVPWGVGVHIGGEVDGSNGRCGSHCSRWFAGVVAVAKWMLGKRVG